VVGKPAGAGHDTQEVDVAVRLFVAIDLDEPIRQKIVRFVEGASGFAPDVRWMKPEALHLTLKFIGEFPDARLQELKQTLATVRSEPFDIAFSGTGFFPTPKAARVFWVGVNADVRLQKLASIIDEAAAKLGIEREARALSVRYADDGVGLPADHQMGNGLTNTGNRISQIGGQISFEPNIPTGLKVRIYLPND